MTFPCPHCGAVYTQDQVAPGDAFTCGECHASVTAPPAASTTPGKSPGRRPAQSHSSPPRAGAPGTRGRTSGSTKNKMLVPLIAAGVVAAGLVAFFLQRGGGDANQPLPNSSPVAPAGPSAPERAQTLVKSVVGSLNLDRAEDCFRAGQALAAKAAEMKSAGADRPVADLVLRESVALREKTLILDPHFGPLREERGELRYTDALLEYINAAWLVETDRIDAKRLHEKLLKASSKSNGWVPKDQLQAVTDLLAKLAPKKEERGNIEASPFFQAARTLEADVKSDLERRFADLPAGQYRGVEMSIEKPYVFFIQTDPSWDPVQVAKSKVRDLKALEDIILQEYGEALGLKSVEEPVPVLFFRNYDMYKKYAGLDEAASTFAHFEPSTGRLAVHDRCDHTTIMHEGTHQLMWAWTDRKVKDGGAMILRSYWFQEGIAEWYGGAGRTPKATGGYDYEIGLLHVGRMSSIRALQTEGGREKLFKLKDLLTRTYGHRPKIEKDGRVFALYAQAWFFIYFMNHFNVDAEGYVDPEKPGKYQAKWRKYVQSELEGRTGIKVFREVMGMSDADIESLEIEFWRFYDYVQRKINVGQVKDKRLVRWDKWLNKRGEALGEKEDDLLPPLEPSNLPKPVGEEK